MVLGVCNNRRKCVGKVLGLPRQHLQTRYLYLILEKMSLEEFIHRDTQQMAKFIAGVKETQPQTKSRHSHQAWIQNYSGQSDKVIASLQEK